MLKFKPNHIVLTSINVPVLLDDYFENLLKYNHISSTKVWIIGDRKTPRAAHDLATRLSNCGLETNYVDIELQDIYGKKFPEFYKLIPYNNETRRNIGYLMALEEGCERLISIDDDNFPTECDFIEGHSITGEIWSGDLICEESGFHNICEYLEFSPSRDVFPRGFPFKLRGVKNNSQQSKANNITIGVNAGLWLKDPDVDATTWLNGKIQSKAYIGSNHYVLSQDTWTPINTQNTSVLNELIPAFLCIPMGWEVPGGKIQRYGDIWGGYFLEAILRGTSYHVAFGQPIVEHRRNAHDYVDDLRFEFWGMILTDILLERLKNKFKPEGNDITERVIQLAIFLRSDFISSLPAWLPNEVLLFIQNIAHSLDIWAKICKEIGTI